MVGDSTRLDHYRSIGTSNKIKQQFNYINLHQFTTFLALDGTSLNFFLGVAKTPLPAAASPATGARRLKPTVESIWSSMKRDDEIRSNNKL